MTLSEALKDVAEAFAAAVIINPAVRLVSVDICEHDDEPGSLLCIADTTDGEHLTATFTDSEPYTQHRRAELEQLFRDAAASAGEVMRLDDYDAGSLGALLGV